jgi:integrase/recombinase XerD
MLIMFYISTFNIYGEGDIMGKEGQAAVLNQEEMKRLEVIIASREQAKRNQSMMDFSFICGMRVKEISSLYLSDVVGKDGKLKKSFTLESKKTKGNKSREIYLQNKTLIKNLKAYLAVRGNQKGPLFLSRKGGSFSPNTMQMAFKRLFSEAGIEGASSHSGRRTFATTLIEKGFNLVMVAELMGHSSIEMTRKYVTTNPVDNAKATMNLYP